MSIQVKTSNKDQTPLLILNAIPNILMKLLAAFYHLIKDCSPHLLSRINQSLSGK